MVSEKGFEILEYIKKHGSANTFRLSSELCLDRTRVLSILQDLEQEGAIEVKSGIAIFLKFPEEKKAKPAKRKVSKKEKSSEVLNGLQAENKKLKEIISELGGAIKALEQKANAPPKVVTRTVIKRVLVREKVPAKEKKEVKKKGRKPKVPKPQKPKHLKTHVLKLHKILWGHIRKVKQLKNIKHRIKFKFKKKKILKHSASLPKLKLVKRKKKRGQFKWLRKRKAQG